MPDSTPDRGATPGVSPAAHMAESGSRTGHGVRIYDYAHRWHQEDDGPSGPASPTSPSMSLPSLLMSPFSPGRQHSASPFISRPSTSGPANYQVDKDYFDESEPDHRELLVRRLGKLAVQVSEQSFVDEKVVDLHARIDEIEMAMGTPPNPLRATPPRLAMTRTMSRNLNDEPREIAPAQRPFSTLNQRPPEPPLVMSAEERLNSWQESQAQINVAEEKESAKVMSKMSLEHAHQIAEEAHALNRGLENAIASLKARQEESDHIHDLLVRRAERAAQHIIHLEDRVKELERERNDGEMEILNLQIQLKAIEVQYMSSESGDADADLRQSISSWKAEWSALKRKRTRKKDDEPCDPESAKTPETPIRRIQRARRKGDANSIISRTPDTPASRMGIAD